MSARDKLSAEDLAAIDAWAAEEEAGSPQPERIKQNRQELFRDLHTKLEELQTMVTYQRVMASKPFALASRVLASVQARQIQSEDLFPTLANVPADMATEHGLVAATTGSNQVEFDKLIGPQVGGLQGRSSFKALRAYAQYMTASEENVCGNCMDMAIVAFESALKEVAQAKANGDKEITALKLIFFGEHQGHFAVLIETVDSKKSIICDPWSDAVFPFKTLSDLIEFEAQRGEKSEGYPSRFPGGIFGSPYNYFSIEGLGPGQALKCMNIVEERGGENGRELLSFTHEEDQVSKRDWQEYFSSFESQQHFATETAADPGLEDLASEDSVEKIGDDQETSASQSVARGVGVARFEVSHRRQEVAHPRQPLGFGSHRETEQQRAQAPVRKDPPPGPEEPKAKIPKKDPLDKKREEPSSLFG